MHKTLCYSYCGEIDSCRGGRVAYVMPDDSTIVFSGITWNKTSTVNVAEDIIRLLCDEEHRGPSSTRFFDLQTCLGYNYHRPGHFQYDEVTVDEHFKNPGWTPVTCPTEIVNLFREYIGGDEVVQINDPATDQDVP